MVLTHTDTTDGGCIKDRATGSEVSNGTRRDIAVLLGNGDSQKSSISNTFCLIKTLTGNETDI